MPRTKKTETETKTTTKKTTKKNEELLTKAFEEFDKSDFINLDFSNITKSLINDIKLDESKREALVDKTLTYINTVENKVRGYYLGGNQYALAAINLHLSRMQSILEVYEFLYTQSANVANHRRILNCILMVINDMLYPRQYEVLNSFGKTYENFVMNVYISTELVNKYNYYNNQLANLR